MYLEPVITMIAFITLNSCLIVVLYTCQWFKLRVCVPQIHMDLSSRCHVNGNLRLTNHRYPRYMTVVRSRKNESNLKMNWNLYESQVQLTSQILAPVKWNHKSTPQSLVNQHFTQTFELLFSFQKREKQSYHFDLGIFVFVFGSQMSGSIGWDYLNYFNTKSQTKKDSFVLRFAPSYQAQKTALRSALETGTRLVLFLFLSKFEWSCSCFLEWSCSCFLRNLVIR